ncbi:hypothetical protein SGUI_2429 [Serinicoccus hydrothermalis]|uniref:Glycosyl transferase family 28 C-terminal domain-containing protein n=1 Tax=Serinicoccus hydrothermalis TaxID=1758689 RepID=A0A1B1NEN9_9MICO|nr:glycosyltransferase [Serinicoccus hydrothermalis]ANS79825.1 hypothetical protein SGUI_2429 [Serinicoccus hydrothermalis]
MIGYYLHHVGQGHRRRGTAVARSLRTEAVGLGSGGPPAGWPGDWVELERDDQPPVDPRLSQPEAGGALHWVPLHHPGLARRHHQVARWLDRARPDLVVVDVSVEIAVLVRLCGVPVVLGGMPGDREDQPHRLARSLAEAVLAPWPPGAHGDGAASGPAPRTWEVGGISALAVAGGAPGEGSARPGTGQGEPGALPAGSGQGATGAVEPGRGPLGAVEPRRGGVLVVWGSGGAGPGEHDVEAARASTGRRWLVRGGDHPPSPDLLAEMRAAEVVVCHAGQGAVADVALAGRPAVVLAQPRPHGEQEATARALERRGLAATASGWPAAEAWPGLLDRALATGGEGWSAWGSQQGAARAAHRLDEAAARLQEQRCWPS